MTVSKKEKMDYSEVKERSLAEWRKVFSLEAKAYGLSLRGIKLRNALLYLPDTIDGRKVVAARCARFYDCSFICNRRLFYQLPEAIQINTAIAYILHPEKFPDDFKKVPYNFFARNSINREAVLEAIIHADHIEVLQAYVALMGKKIDYDAIEQMLALAESTLACKAYIMNLKAERFSAKRIAQIESRKMEKEFCFEERSMAEYVIRNGILRKYTGKDNHVVIPDGVTSIGPADGLFDIEYNIAPDVFNSSELTSIIIPNSVTSIGKCAFAGCSKLTSITIPDSVTSIGHSAFRGCSSLTSITIPNSVTSVEPSAFRGCSSLTSITIPDSVTSIGKFAFASCSKLTHIVIPDSVTSIGTHAFADCSELTSITIPDSVTSIGECAFENCNRLATQSGLVIAKNTILGFKPNASQTHVIIPDTVTSIGTFAFGRCYELTHIVIPDSVTSIGEFAFASCSKLTHIVIPDSVTSIGNSAFGDCYSLASVTIPDTVTSIGNSTFKECSHLPNIVIPDSVTSIGRSAFKGCCELTSITIPNSVTSIGDSAFEDCVELDSISIGGSVVSIGNAAFKRCCNLTSLVVPDQVKDIGESAFAYCTSLKHIVLSKAVMDSVESAWFHSRFYGVDVPFIWLEGNTNFDTRVGKICRKAILRKKQNYILKIIQMDSEPAMANFLSLVSDIPDDALNNYIADSMDKKANAVLAILLDYKAKHFIEE